MLQFVDIEGVVEAGETWSETHVSGSGSAVGYGGMVVGNSRVTSNVTTQSQIWVRTDEGAEIALRINPNAFAVRPGHRVAMRISPRKAGPSGVFAGRNLTTGAEFRSKMYISYVSAVGFMLLFGWMGIVAIFINALLGLAVSAVVLGLPLYLIAYTHALHATGRDFLAHPVERLADAAGNLISARA